jgi:23S rRNA pseudouridine2605 synthase
MKSKATKTAETKPKARKKKVVENAEVSIPEVIAVSIKIEAVDSEPVKTKPAKKAPAKKAVPYASEAAGELLEVQPKPKRATKPKKDKGRDLVVDEPGAVEVAEVLAEAKADAAKAVTEASGPAPKLERLQKILAKAGISSRRKAEELILGGQVQINGQVVTELGTKADPERDHVRVDGKLLQGPERIRYFVLNKPKGFVTTVSDPEGRPTVMEFFATERERLYPVGRLDYLSEGLLLVTNDGELANKLTKASSGVEKTYLVKVSGQPTEDMLDVLRGGVVIEKGRPGNYAGRVRTAPAKIRQVREGDNPWYEVIIIEGRNRELRKMFEEIGHHVEKIRRIGYGPLVLDLEPGKSRELDAEEVQQLRLASEGKLKTRRRRGPKEAQLPTVAGKTVRYKKADGKAAYEPRTRPMPRPEFQTESKSELKPAFKKEFNREIKAGFKREPKPEFGQTYKKEFNPAYKKEFKPGAQTSSRPNSGPDSRPDAKPAFRPRPDTGGKPEFRATGKPSFGGRPAFGSKPRSNRTAEPPVTDYILPPRKNRPDADFDADAPEPKREFNPDYKPGFRTGTGSKPAFRSDAGPGNRPAFRKDGSPKRFGSTDSSERPDRPGRSFKPAPADDDDFVPTKTPGFKIEPVEDRPRTEDRRSSTGGRPFRPQADGPRGSGFGGGSKTFRPATTRSSSPRPSGSRPATGDRPFRPRPGATQGANSDRPYRPGAARTGDFRPRAGEPSGGSPTRRPKSFDSAGDAPRDFRPREGKSFGGPKKFGSPKPFGAKPSGTKPLGAKKFDAPRPAPGGSNSVPVQRFGPDGQPRIKERARNSFSGKNKGRPKPKGKSDSGNE